MANPPDELRILVAGSSVLPEQTCKALCDALAEHGRDVLDEASRVAAAQHSGPGEPMITPGMVTDMATWVRRGYIQKQFSKQQLIAAAVGGATTFGGGIFVNNITKPWGAVGFAICALILLICIYWGSK
ncbi:hypothetical protein [Actinomadura sp. NPDC049753]|uniref:hypothetical protein n=1 Tax=Actinomadura sp. NPDC049753 TaxID=3154739 RepID=UPI003423408E